MKLSNVLSGVINTSLAAGIVASSFLFTYDARAKEFVDSVSNEDKYCLQQNIFFEARNQDAEGQLAVGWVTMNRVHSSKYPDSICDVVWQRKQFSWTHDGKSDKPAKNAVAQEAWELAGHVVNSVLYDFAYGKEDPVNGAILYHADYVNPYWAKSYQQVKTIDSHIFYK